MKLKKHLAILAIAVAGSGAAQAAAVSVAFDNLLSGVTDDGGTGLVTTAQLGWFQSDPSAIGLDVAALQADFIEVGAVSTDQVIAGAFNTAFNFDDTGSFEGTPYANFAGQTMWGLMVSGDGQSLGLVSFSETFPVGESAVPRTPVRPRVGTPEPRRPSSENSPATTSGAATPRFASHRSPSRPLASSVCLAPPCCSTGAASNSAFYITHI